MYFNHRVTSHYPDFHFLVKLLILTVMALPIYCFSQAPPLGTAESFAVFTSVGAIDNTGASVITGDMGTNSGTLTGFPPGTLIGNVQLINTVTAQAAIDVQTAYTFMTSLTCGTTIGAALGSGQTLTPDVYCITTAATLTGDLTLDALGDPNAIFIIKINGALSTATSTNILLTNSADVCNIYWQVGGLFTLSDNSLFKGTVIADGAISILTDANLEGRILTRAGAISLSSNNITLGCGPILPIKLYSFTVQCEEYQPTLQWITASEMNNDFFTIERSTNATDWNEVGKVDGAGNSTNQLVYKYTDKAHRAHAYYRIKQTDFDGSFEYSSFLFLENCSNVNVVNIYPNPSQGIINMSIDGNMDSFESIEVFSPQGLQLYYSKEFQSKIDLSAAGDGIYFIHLKTTSGTTMSKIIINKL